MGYRTLTRHNIEKQEMQQIMELLLAMQEQMRANDENLMAKLDAWGSDNQEETLTCQEMEARPEEEKPASAETKPEAAQKDEVPVEKPAQGRKKQHRGVLEWPPVKKVVTEVVR